MTSCFCSAPQQKGTPRSSGRTSFMGEAWTRRLPGLSYLGCLIQVASQTEGRQGRVSTEPARRDARERQVQNLQRTVRPAADRRQLSSHKLLRINGHLYTVSHKSGKRALVGQAGGCLTRSNIEVIVMLPTISAACVPCWLECHKRGIEDAVRSV